MIWPSNDGRSIPFLKERPRAGIRVPGPKLLVIVGAGSERSSQLANQTLNAGMVPIAASREALVRVYTLIQPRQRPLRDVGSEVVTDHVADHFLQFPFGYLGRNARRVLGGHRPASRDRTGKKLKD